MALVAIVPYLGGKSQSGVWQRIINLIPPHQVFIEPFAGSAAIARLKIPAGRTILIDRKPDPGTLALPSGAEWIQGCGIEYLETHLLDPQTFVYADPPYVLSTRKFRRIYKFEMSDSDHARLLAALRKQTCPVLLSGYPSRLYETALHDWNCERFQVMNRGHKWATECLWWNYPRPELLNEYGHVGDNFRERWRITKKRRRWAARLIRQDPLERSALFTALVDVMGADAVHNAVNSVIPGTRAVNSAAAGKPLSR